MDSTLAQGLLSRLDVLTAKLGIGAGALWSLWLHTWWRPWLDEVMLGTAFLVALVGTVWVVRRWIAAERKNVDGGADPALAMGGTIGIGATFTLFVFVVLHLSDCIAYTVNHSLYALDQLRGLVGH